MTTQLGKATRFVLGLTVVALTLIVFHTSTFAQYRQFNLVSTSSPRTPHNDPNLINGWGLAFFPTSPFWVANEATGTATLYDHSGTPVPLIVTIPPAPSQPFGPQGTPTGLIANDSGGFMVSGNGNSGSAFFIFDTLDGTISGWNPNVD